MSTDPVRLVPATKAEEIRRNVAAFTQACRERPDRVRALKVLSYGDYWVFDPDIEGFALAKFAGYKDMTLDRYESARYNGFEGSFTGGIQNAIAEVLDQRWRPDSQLADKLSAFVYSVLGPNTLSSDKWEFIRLKAAPASAQPKRAADPFEVGQSYTREQIQRLLGLEPQTGGNWFTGYHRHDNQWFLFPSVGVAGRTGHDYGNRWEGERLVWFGRTDSRISHESIQSLIDPSAAVHLFTREDDRGPFEYQGLVGAVEIFDEVPVRIIWERHGLRTGDGFQLPEELPASGTFNEGARMSIVVNKYERDERARQACIEHWGVCCAVCGQSLEEIYGPVAAGYAHVHHLSPLGDGGGQRSVDPINDLRPVCPNCHAVIHMRRVPFTIDEVRAMLQQ